MATVKRLHSIRKAAFDETYLAECAPNNPKLFKESSCIVAQDDRRIIGYYVFQKPGDKASRHALQDVNTELQWRNALLKGRDIPQSAINYCRHASGLDFDRPGVQAFPVRTLGSELRAVKPLQDVCGMEMAIMPEYQGQGIGRALLQEVVAHHVPPNGVFFARTRNDVMSKNFERSDFDKLIVYGPALSDGSSYSLWMKK